MTEERLEFVICVLTWWRADCDRIRRRLKPRLRQRPRTHKEQIDYYRAKQADAMNESAAEALDQLLADIQAPIEQEPVKPRLTLVIDHTKTPRPETAGRGAKGTRD